jgi:hypothetical protein
VPQQLCRWPRPPALDEGEWPIRRFSTDSRHRALPAVFLRRICPENHAKKLMKTKAEIAHEKADENYY